MIRRPRCWLVPALLAALPGCGPAVTSVAESPTARVARLWPQLAGGTLADRITDPMVSIRHDQGPSSRFHASWIGVALDGNVVFARRLDRTRPPEGDLPIFDGRVRPGRHHLGVYVQVDQSAEDQLAAEPTNQLSLDADKEFLVSEGQFAAITTRTRDYDPARPPSLDIEVQFRPVRSD